MSKIITADFDGKAMQFREDGWFNATVAAERFGKRLDHWLANRETGQYITALSELLNTRNPGELIHARKGRNGGTWLHPKLAVAFARWLDVRFAVWCDMQIDGLLRCIAQPDSWHQLRHDAGARFRGVCDMVNLSRQAIGKSTAPHHYANEAKLINWAMTGSYAPINRDSLTAKQLRLLELLEAQDMLLIGSGLGYDGRKRVLSTFAAEQCQRLALPANDVGRLSA